MDAVLIQRPIFRVQLAHPQQMQAQPTVGQRVNTLGQRVLQGIKHFGACLKEAHRHVFFYALFATRVALIYATTPAVAAIVFVAAMAIGYVSMAIVFACRDLMTQTAGRPGAIRRDLNSYAQGSRINTQKFQSAEIKVDMSGVPATVTLDQMTTILANTPIYSAIEFPAHRREVGAREEPKDEVSPNHWQPVSKAKLQTYLQRLINNIKNKAAWVGTPPQPGSQALVDQYYNKLSDLIRYSLHKRITAHDNFVQTHGVPARPADDSSDEEKALYQQYLNVLEDRNNFVIDMAITGGHCGGRAMTDALEAYCQITGESAGETGTFQERVAYVAGQARVTVMKADVAEVHRNHAHNTHHINAYMMQLGPTLGIPGSDGVVESIFRIDEHVMLGRFFNRYPNTLIASITDKYKISEGFRHLFQEWLKERVGNWNQERYDGIYNGLRPQIDAIRSNPQSAQAAQITREQVETLIRHLKTNNPEELETIIVERNGEYIFVGGETERSLSRAPIQEVITALSNMSEAREWIIGNTTTQTVRDELDQHGVAIRQLGQIAAAVKGANQQEEIMKSSAEVFKGLIAHLEGCGALNQVVCKPSAIFLDYYPEQRDIVQFRHPRTGAQGPLANASWNDVLTALMDLREAREYMRGLGVSVDRLDMWKELFAAENASTEATQYKDYLDVRVKQMTDSTLFLRRLLGTADPELPDVKVLTSRAAGICKKWDQATPQDIACALATLPAAERVLNIPGRSIQEWAAAFSSSNTTQVAHSERKFVEAALSNRPQDRMQVQALPRQMKKVKENSLVQGWMSQLSSVEVLGVMQATLEERTDAAAQESFAAVVAAQLRVQQINQALIAQGLPSISGDEQVSFVRGMLDQNASALHDVVKEYLQRTRQTEFLTALMGEDVVEGRSPIRKELVEWALVSEGHFLS